MQHRRTQSVVINKAYLSLSAALGIRCRTSLPRSSPVNPIGRSDREGLQKGPRCFVGQACRCLVPQSVGQGKTPTVGWLFRCRLAESSSFILEDKLLLYSTGTKCIIMCCIVTRCITMCDMTHCDMMYCVLNQGKVQQGVLQYV